MAGGILIAAAVALTHAPEVSAQGGSGSRAGRVISRLALRDTAPTEVAAELTRVLRIPVEVRGGMGRRLTLDLPVSTPERAVEQVAQAMEGTWKLELRVRPGVMGTERIGAPDKTLSLGVQGLPATRAFEVVARELRAELSAPLTLDRKVSVLAVNVPVDSVLDQIAEQAGATWSLVYVITAPALREAPAPREERPQPLPVPPPVRPTVPPMPQITARPSAPSALSGSELKAAVQATLRTLLQSPAGSRGAAVREAVQALERLGAPVSTLGFSERSARKQSLAGVLNLWKRVVAGAAPAVGQELAPVTEVLERRFR